MEHVEVLRDLSEVCRAAIKAGDWKVDGACDPDAVLRRADAAIAALSAPQSRDAESKLAEAGVFAGHHGLRGLADADEFWEKQPYGTRLYYGDGGMDYLHRGVLQKAVEILDAAPQPPAEAQAQGGGEVAYFRKEMLRRCRDYAAGMTEIGAYPADLEAALAPLLAPPSAPVGDDRWKALIGQWQRRVEAAGYDGVEDALDAAVAAKSAPVGVVGHVKALRELRDTGDVSDWRLFESALDAAIAALAQQPAAVDGAARRRDVRLGGGAVEAGRAGRAVGESSMTDPSTALREVLALSNKEREAEENLEYGAANDLYAELEGAAVNLVRDHGPALLSALEDAPQPAPAAQGFDAELVAAGERLVNLIEGPGCMRWEDGQGFRLKDTTEWSVFYIAIKRALATAAKGVPAKGFDAEFWKKAWVEERARAYRREGMTVEQAKIHAETDAQAALAAAAKGVGND